MIRNWQVTSVTRLISGGVVTLTLLVESPPGTWKTFPATTLTINLATLPAINPGDVVSETFARDTTGIVVSG